MAKTDKNKTRKKYGSTERIDDRQVLNILNEEVVYYLAQNKAAKKNGSSRVGDEQPKRKKAS